VARQISLGGRLCTKDRRRKNKIQFRYVQDLLGRKADASGLANWVAALNQGVSRSQVASDIENSDEIDLREWRGRPLWEKLVGTCAWILERQQ